MKKLEYRKDIDGLRGIAVLSVILFHAGVPLFDAGFIGVDIFFVISGYLITSIILIDKENGTFSLWGFYERRARRILPALFVVMATCLLLAWQWMVPNQLKNFGQSLFATSLSLSNIFFWKKTGYFALASEKQPLIHTWSLAVEEQFYILFPMIILLVWKWKRKWLFPLIVIGIGISFGLSELGWRYKPTTNFYWMPTRAWQIGIGCIAAFLDIYHRDKIHRVLKRFIPWLSTTGFIMIVASIIMFDKHIPNPSYWALFPLMGTALILLFPISSSLAHKLLTFKPLTAIGLISYSAYLWHQPIFAFLRIRALNEPNSIMFFVGIVCTLLLSWFSWKYIEQPCRKGSIWITQTKRFLVAMALCFVVLIFSGWQAHYDQGFPQRLSEDIQYLADTGNLFVEAIESCHGQNSQDECNYGDVENLEIALLGDSHALALSHHLDESLKQINLGFKRFTKNSCIPIASLGLDMAGSCRKHNQDVINYLTTHNELNTVIMLARWTLYLECRNFDNGEGGVEHNSVCVTSTNKTQPPISEDTRIHNISSYYTQGIQSWLNKGKKVILIYPVPEVGWHVPHYVMQGMLFRKPHDVVSTNYSVFLERNHNAYQALDAIGEHPNLYRIYPEDIFCNTFIENSCVAYWQGESFYYDDDHLSLAGSKLVVDEVVKAVRNANISPQF